MAAQSRQMWHHCLFGTGRLEFFGRITAHSPLISWSEKLYLSTDHLGLHKVHWYQPSDGWWQSDCFVKLVYLLVICLQINLHWILASLFLLGSISFFPQSYSHFLLSMTLGRDTHLLHDMELQLPLIVVAQPTLNLAVYLPFRTLIQTRYYTLKVFSLRGKLFGRFLVCGWLRVETGFIK